MTKPTTSFKGIIDRFDSNLWHYYVKVPIKIAQKFIEGKDKRVVCTLNRTETFHAALMHLGDGGYFIMVNKQLRSKLKVKDGDEILVALVKDESEYGLPLPDEFKELLQQDIDGNAIFQSLTAGKQRTLLYIIGKPKSPDLRIRNGIVILEHLKRNMGKIDYKQLNLDMKNTF
ncbi:MAG: YdeI/OmpD-associated family protein [Bacteroidota bacterium]